MPAFLGMVPFQVTLRMSLVGSGAGLVVLEKSRESAAASDRSHSFPGSLAPETRGRQDRLWAAGRGASTFRVTPVQLAPGWCWWSPLPFVPLRPHWLSGDEVRNMKAEATCSHSAPTSPSFPSQQQTGHAWDLWEAESFSTFCQMQTQHAESRS